jgi:hypothetical protein
MTDRTAVLGGRSDDIGEHQRGQYPVMAMVGRVGSGDELLDVVDQLVVVLGPPAGMEVPGQLGEAGLEDRSVGEPRVGGRAWNAQGLTARTHYGASNEHLVVSAEPLVSLFNEIGRYPHPDFARPSASHSLDPHLTVPVLWISHLDDSSDEALASRLRCLTHPYGSVVKNRRSFRRDRDLRG